AEYSPDGKQTVTAGGDGVTRIWDAATGKLLLDTLKHDAPVYFVTFSPDGKRVATASTDKSARVWDAVTGFGRQVRESRQALLSSMAAPFHECSWRRMDTRCSR